MKHSIVSTPVTVQVCNKNFRNFEQKHLYDLLEQKGSESVVGKGVTIHHSAIGHCKVLMP